MKLRKNDKVRVVKGTGSVGEHIGQIGTVYSVHSDNVGTIQFDDGIVALYRLEEDSFEKVFVGVDTADIGSGTTVSVKQPNKLTKFMRQIPSTLKRVLSPELSEQYKAGYINGDLSLTEAGKRELLEILAEEHKGKLAARAKEQNDEEEKSNQ